MDGIVHEIVPTQTVTINVVVVIVVVAAMVVVARVIEPGTAMSQTI